jgi:DMSO/TMAO reductase YedYZ molybdopterin-dependent catalytic subunit
LTLTRDAMPNISSAPPSGARHPIFNPERRDPTWGDFSQEEVRLANRNSGTLLETLRHDVTPAGLHYLLIHFDVPYVPVAHDWMLVIGGCVERPLTLTLDELKRHQNRTLRVTMECAGNGRAAMTPRRPTQPWLHEAVGTAEWTGTPLKPLLESAGLAANAHDVVFFGRDRGFDCGIEHDYGRSLSPEQALRDDVLLSWAMNGAELPPQHGFPLRLVVPGWYGMASVKWLDRITVIDHAFDGHQQVGSYIYREHPDEPGVPVSAMRVKSLMVPPGVPDFYSRRRLVEQGSVQIFGRAWSGDGVPIVKVEVGVDGHWHDARLDAPIGRYAWRGWQFDWDATPGEHDLMCRATDANGDTQPVEQRFDCGGFGNNAVHRIQVTVR